MINKHLRPLAWIFPLLMLACQSLPPPATDLVETKIYIENAIEAEAEIYAPVELQFAKEKLARAENLIADNDYSPALRLAVEARTDAELALLRSQLAKLRAEVNAKMTANQELRTELMQRGEQ